MKNNFGFTLMELMIAIAIVAILSAVAVPNMIAWRNNAQFNSGVRQVKIAIEETRMDAIKTNMPSRIIFKGNSFDRVKGDTTVQSHELPPGVTISSSTFADDQVRFISQGLPVRSNNAFNTGTVTIQGSAGQTRDIVVAITGTSIIK